jgi:sugar lactone lactonase YvrE
MPNRLIKLRAVSVATSTPGAGPGSAQQVNIPITGLVDGAGIAVDRSENIYVSDFDQHVIYKYRRGASASQIFAGAYGVSGNVDGQYSAARFNKPGAMFCDNSGRLWVVDVGNARIRRIDENGNVFTVATIPIEQVGDNPGSIVVDASENIFFIDSTV